MAYSITTKDGITINNIPDDVAPDSPELKDRVAKIRAGQTEKPTTKPERGLGEEFVRQAGLSARAPIAATSSVLGLVGDPLNALVNLIAGSKLPTLRGATEQLLTQAGMPEPETPLERGVYNVSTAGYSALGPGAAITRLVRQPTTVAPQVARMEPTFAAQTTPALSRLATQAPGQQLTGAIGGELATQIAAQAGGGPVAQMASGLLGGVLAPSAAQLTGTRTLAGGRELVRPFTESGREVIAGNVLRSLAAQPEAATARAAAYEPRIPGYQPTTAQATRDVGLISAETPIRALDTTGKFAAQASQANQARMSILDRMAKDTDALNAAKAKRDEVTTPLRENAFAKSTVSPDMLQSSIALTVEKKIDDILASSVGARKPVKDAMQFARERLKDGTDPARLYEVRKDLRDAAQGLLNREQSSYNLAKGELEQVIRAVDDVLEASAPGYREYLRKYASSSKGIERLEAIQDFRKKVLTTTPDPGRVSDYLISQPAFTRAIRAIEDDPKLGGLSKTQFAVLKRVGQDLDDGVLARAAKTPGSDTFKNMSTANVIGGIIGKQIFGETSPFLNKVASPLNWLYNGTDDAIREVLVDAMLDPKFASKLMQKATTASVEPISKELQRKAISLGYGSIFGLTE